MKQKSRSGNRSKSPPLLELREITLERGPVKILHRVSWRVEKGEHWVILGPNGSGKSSVLNILLGYQFPTSGEVRLLSRRFGESDWRELREQIGYVGLTIGLQIPPDEPVLETVVSGKTAMLAYWGKMPEADATHARSILRRLGCDYLADRLWGVISQGERQKVMIARALMGSPSMIILDEPCAGLDPVARENFLEWLNHFKRLGTGTTFILVTHHLEEVVPLFTNVLLLKGGTVLAAGRKREVLQADTLSHLFQAPVRLRRLADGRSHFQFLPRRAALRQSRRGKTT